MASSGDVNAAAETIRRFANDTDPTGEVVAALDVLVAEVERQKAQADLWRRLNKASVVRNDELRAERDAARQKRDTWEASVKALRVEKQQLEERCKDFEAAITEYDGLVTREPEVDRLRAREQRLQEALREIADNPYGDTSLEFVRGIARAALTKETK